MHAELSTFFATHEKTTCQCRRDTDDSLITMLDLHKTVSDHIAQLTYEFSRAMLAPHDARLDGKLEYIRTRLVGLRACADAMLGNMQALSSGFAEMEKAFSQDALDVAAVLGNIDPALVQKTPGIITNLSQT